MASACRYPNADEHFGLVQDLDGDGFNDNVDCDDSDEDVNPDADEVCNGIDDDCADGVDVDAIDEVTFWVDADADGFGDDDLPTVQACEAPEGHAAQGGDCDDTDKDFNPDAIEINDDGIDQDCNGADTVPCFKDDDHDGFGNDGGLTVFAPDGSCDTAQGESDNDDDCDDDDETTNPDGTDVPTDLIDQDCSGAPAVPCWFDDDGDGQGDAAIALAEDVCGDEDGESANDDDCDDTDSTVKVGATELCDGQLNACGGTMLPTEDNEDSDAFVACALDGGGWDGAGTVTGGNDCDDTDNTVFPGATELCDGQKNNCSGAMLANEGNLDGDAFVACTLDAGGWDGPGTVTGGGDCLDTAGNGATVFPGAPELCDGIDNSCDAALSDLEDDDDDDDYVECNIDGGGWDGADPPTPGLDCNDANAQTFPGAPELCDGFDNSCNNSITDEHGRVSFQPATPGPWTDQTLAVDPADVGSRGAFTASVASGTLWLCATTPYTFNATITVPTTITSFTVQGRNGADLTILSGADPDAATTPAARIIDHTGSGGGSLTVRGLTLRHGTAGSGNGGAINFAGSPTTALIEDSVIEDSLAALGGGVYLNGGALTVTETSISGGTATDGGNLYVNGGTLFFDPDSAADDGTAQRGGGIYVKAGTVDIFGNIEGNTATGGDENGGGIYFLAGDVDLDGAFISDNHADNDGGGVWAAAGVTRFDLDTSTFTLNTANGDGGGLYSIVPSPDLDGVTFSDNTADINDSDAGRGGGIYVESATLFKAVNLDLIDNGAERGGGYYQLSGIADLTGVLADGNQGQGADGADGGGAFGISEGTLDITDCEIANNDTVGDGAALFVDDNTTPPAVTFDDCTIGGSVADANIATDEGGAISCRDSCTIVAIDTIISHNVGRTSGAVDLDTATSSFTCSVGPLSVGAVRLNLATDLSADANNYAGGVHLGGDAATTVVISTGCDWGTGATDNFVDSTTPLAADVGSNDVAGASNDGYRVGNLGAGATFTCTAAGSTCAP